MAKSKTARTGSIKKVALGKMHISSRHAQREKINQSRVEHLLANFDLDELGTPVLSERGGEYYIIDGQHRIEALKAWLGPGWESQQIECWVYTGLSESEEAEKFLKMNDTLTVNVFDKFRTAVSAGRPDEVAISRLVQRENLCISRDKMPGAIQAVGTLRRVYGRSDGPTLAKTLRVIRDAYGDPGFCSLVIDGVGHLCQRYNGVLDETETVERLASLRGGVNGLLGRAEVLHKTTGHAKSQCVAAAAVDVLNRSRRGKKKLPQWWAHEG